MKDSYSFDVDDAGLERVVRGRTARRTSRPSTASASTTSSSRRCPARWAAAAARSSSRPPRSARTPSSAARTCDYAANIEAVTTPVPPPRSVRRPARRARRGHPRHPDDRDARRARQRARSRAPDRPWTAADTLKNVARHARAPGRHARAAGRRRARRPRRRRRSGSRPHVAPAEVEAFNEADFAAHPGAGQGVHRPRGARRGLAHRHPLPARPARGRRHARGSPAPTSPAGTSSTWSRAATSPATARSRPPRCATATRARSAAARSTIARGIEIGHIFQLGRKYADALGLEVLGRERQARHGHDGLLRHRRLPRRRRDRRGDARRARASCWPREVAPADVHVVATGKDDGGVRDRRPDSPASSRRPASACSTTTGPRCRPASSSRTPS